MCSHGVSSVFKKGVACVLSSACLTFSHRIARGDARTMGGAARRPDKSDMGASIQHC